MRNHRISKVVFTDHDGIVYNEIYAYDDDGCLQCIRIDADDAIKREHRFFYNGDLLCKSEIFRRGELWKYINYEYEEPVTASRSPDNNGIHWLFEKVLTKDIHHNPDGSVKYFHTFIFEEGRLLKQTQYASDGGARYEYICQYENGKRIRTLKANLEIFSYRIYDRHGVLSEIRFSTGSRLRFLHEPEISAYNFDWYHAF